MAKFIVTCDGERCKGCELCVSVCPVKILALEEEKLNSKGYHPIGIKDQSKCVGCTSCAIMCPEVALTIVKED